MTEHSRSQVAVGTRPWIRRGPAARAMGLGALLLASVGMRSVTVGERAGPAGGRAVVGRDSLQRGVGVVPRMGIARLQYDGGGDWYANPSSLGNLLKAVNERTAMRVEATEGRVTLMDEKLYDYTFLHATGHGVIKFSDAEVARLREWILRGGFLHVDDNYGLDETFRKEIARVFPDRPLQDVPLNHPIYHVVYDFPKGVPKIHEHDGKPARGFGVFVGDRLAVYYTQETDLGNGWEDLGTYANDPPELHETALRMGVNLFVYAVTSRPVQ